MPGYLILASPDYQKMYWLKVIRFIHIRTVWNAVEEYIEKTLNRFGLTKPVIKKATYILILIIQMFSSIHILACIWIYIGKRT